MRYSYGVLDKGHHKSEVPISTRYYVGSGLIITTKIPQRYMRSKIKDIFINNNNTMVDVLIAETNPYFNICMLFMTINIHSRIIDKHYVRWVNMTTDLGESL